MSTGLRAYLPRPGTLASVALAAPIFPPLELHGFVWIALVPWLLTLEGCRSIGQAAVQGFWLNFWVGFFWAFWIPPAVPEYLGLPFSLGLAALTLNTSFHQLHLVPVAAALQWLLRRADAPLSVAGGVAAALLYCGLDWALPGIFQHTLGVALHDYRALGQLVEFGGAHLLTFLVLVVNLALFSVVQLARSSPLPARARVRGAVARVAGIALLLAGGTWLGATRYEQATAAIEGAPRSVRVGLVQGNVSNDTKRRWRRGDPVAAREALEVYIRSTQVLMEQTEPPDWIVWPETAYPGIFRKPENDAQAALNVGLDRYIARHGVPFVIGAYDREERADARVLRNAIFFVEPAPGQAPGELSPAAVYHKYILFPVGEYLPFAGRRALREWLPAAGSFSRGEGPRVFSIDLGGRGDPLRVGPSICYEDLFPEHAIGLARAGAELLVNVSNDSWFGDHGLPRFHLIFAKLRSIETRLPQVRATNTGYSALILPNGDVPHESDYGQRQAMNLTVPIPARRDTWMTRWGDWFGPTSLVTAIAGLLWIRRFAR